MNSHKNARLTRKGRELLIDRLARGEFPVDVAAAMGVSVRTVYKWRKRYRDCGPSGLLGPVVAARVQPGPDAGHGRG